GEDGASRQSVRIHASGRFVQWRVAQIHLARRAPSLFITRDAQNRWRGEPARKLYKKTSFSDLKSWNLLELSYTLAFLTIGVEDSSNPKKMMFLYLYPSLSTTIMCN
ncbi:hypothetical protein A2U01_0062345, partial [Trifolium medium]|nr:hypothetical protein [Trifolium medium]